MRKPVASILAASLLATPALAREVDRQEIAEVFAEGVPQQQRVYCRDTQLFTLTDGTEYRACVDWRAQNRTRLTRTYATLEGPDSDTEENLVIARDCFDLAVASANDPYRTALDEDVFLAAANAEFTRCTTARNLQNANRYEIEVYDTAVWLGGSWEQDSTRSF